jgi:hypothetical protein
MSPSMVAPLLALAILLALPDTAPGRRVAARTAIAVAVTPSAATRGEGTSLRRTLTHQDPRERWSEMLVLVLKDVL